MTEMPSAEIVNVLARLLREAFAGAPGPWTYFTDTGPGSGLLGTVDALSAAQASLESGPGGTTVAGHVHHVCSSLALSVRELQGQSVSRDRTQSWTVSVVDDAAWADLRARLRREYRDATMAVETVAEWNEDRLATAFGAVAHAAYHLGAIRQRVVPTAAGRRNA
jgi:hypothetical protein